MSKSASRLAGRTGAAPRRRSGRRALAALQRAVGHRQRLGVRAAKCVATSSIISPAPTNSTLVSRRSSNSCEADAPPRGHADRVGADLGGGAHLGPPRSCAGTSGAAWCPGVPAESASRTACFIWPRICGSPSTIESSPLATRRHGAPPGCPRTRRNAGAGSARRRRSAPASRSPASAANRVGADIQLGRDCRWTRSPPRWNAAAAEGAQRRRDLLGRERKPAVAGRPGGRVVQSEGKTLMRRL